MIAKLDVGAKGCSGDHLPRADFPAWTDFSATFQRLKGAAKLRPDSKLVRDA
jgi:hypothetical protein